MMSPEQCQEQAAHCASQGEVSSDPAVRADWLAMAGHWRALGDDPDGRGVIGWLMQGARLGD